MTTEIATNTPAEVASAYGKECQFERYLAVGSADHNGYRYENIIPWNTSESVWISQDSIIRAEHIKLAEQGYIRGITPPPPRRPLSSLSDDEAKECFRIAFAGMGLPAGYAAMQPAEIDGELRIRQGWDAELIIFADGSISAFEPSARVGALRFNAVAVVHYLDKLGIDIGVI